MGQVKDWFADRFSCHAALAFGSGGVFGSWLTRPYLVREVYK